MTRRTRKIPSTRPSQTSPKASSGSQPWLGWAALILVGIIVLIGIALIVEQLNDEEPPIGAEVQVTPIVGGMVVPTTVQDAASGEPEVTVTGSGADQAAAGVGATEAVTPTESGSVTRTAGMSMPAESAGGADPQVTQVAGDTPVFAPGETVQNRGGTVTIYAEPSADGLILDQYAAGVLLTVLEPGGDFNGYPVEVAGEPWVRVRAADGLVGWTPAPGLSLVE